MNSSDSCRLLNLEHDLPTTREDVLALRRARHSGRMNFEQYLEFLANFPPPTPSALRARKGPTGDKPFEL